MRQQSAKHEIDPKRLQLRGNTCLVKVIMPAERTTKGGIIIPTKSLGGRKEVKRGVLVASGPDAPVEVTVGASKGHSAILHGYAQEQVALQWEGQEYAVYHGDDIEGIEGGN